MGDRRFCPFQENGGFHAAKIAINNVADKEVANKELDGPTALVNRAWEQRKEISPGFETRRRSPHGDLPAPAVNQLQKCREPACCTFALGITGSQRKLEDFPVLVEQAYADQLEALRGRIIDAPAIGW